MLKRALCLLSLFIATSLYGQVPQAEPVDGQTSAVEPAQQQAAPPAAVAGTRALTPVGSGVNTTNPLTVLLALAAILAIIFGCAWLMKRIGGLNVGGASGMKIIAGISVGPREKVLLIEIGQRQVLIGVAPGRVSHLESYSEPVTVAGSADKVDFASRLKSLVTPAHSDNGRDT